MGSKIDFTAHQISFGNDKTFRKNIKRATGFRPGKLIYYKLACVHRSASFYNQQQLTNNERLEYLGDAILGAVVAEYLFKKFPDKDEGFLTKFRAKLVNGQTLNELAERTGLSELLFTRSLDKEITHHIYGDFFEAVIGAIFLDKGYKTTRKFIIKRVLEQLIDLDEIKRRDTNYKSLLIEWAQKHKNLIKFETTCIDNVNAHKPEFETRVIIADKDLGSGKGRSKKEAEQNAAREALIYLES